jgi:hypothetical protein
MSDAKPKTPSELHPDYPKGTNSKCPTTGLTIYKYPSCEAFQSFWQAHPEFKDEAAYEMRCTCCGYEVDSDHRWCNECQEFSGDWQLVNEEGEEVSCVHCSDLGWNHERFTYEREGRIDCKHCAANPVSSSPELKTTVDYQIETSIGSCFVREDENSFSIETPKGHSPKKISKIEALKLLIEEFLRTVAPTATAVSNTEAMKIAEPTCTCAPQDLFNFGCKCGFLSLNKKGTSA